MRRLRRPSASLPTLTADGKGARKAANLVLQQQQDENAPLTFPDHWNEPDVRGALYAMHGRVCAYCQCNLPQNDPGDIEHFRPKSTYWWLAYDFTNYFLSCGTCNRIRKREQFPLPEGTAPCSYANRAGLAGERHLLLDPTIDLVEDWLRVDYVDEICPVRPAAHLPAGIEPEVRTRKTIDFFKLNENVKLVQQRIQEVNRVLEAVKLARKGDADRADELKRMASRFRPHGAAVRQILAELAPDLLPADEEDLFGLILELLADLELADKALARTPGSRIIRKLQVEVRWALAVLWKYPPAATPEQVEDWLTRAGRHDEVASLYASL